ncbi:MAG: transcriptional regulator [Lewinellaceae bacterium]|nr:transcriptional regulator [Lewinellaceae bacterium]
MQANKKVEIIINKLESRQVLLLLKRQNIRGFTFWDGVKGQGDRGQQDGHGLSETFMNTYFVIACTEEEFARIKEKLRNLLREVGGVCMVSDVEWLLH